MKQETSSSIQSCFFNQSESEWIEEVLILLLGWNTIHFHWMEDRIVIKDVQMEREWSMIYFREIEWFFSMAQMIKRLSLFVQSKIFMISHTCKCLQRYVSEINDHIKQFWNKIGDLQLEHERKRMMKNKQTLEDIRLSLIAPLRKMSFIHNINQKVFAGRSEMTNSELSGLLLSQLYELLSDLWTQVDVYGQYDLLLKLFLTSLEPYLEILQGWIMDGTLENDSFGEFMIQNQSSLIDPYHPNFWEQAYQISSISTPCFFSKIQQEILITGKTEKVLIAIRKEQALLGGLELDSEELFIKEEKYDIYSDLMKIFSEEDAFIQDSYLDEFLFEDVKHINSTGNIKKISQPIQIVIEKGLIKPILNQFKKTSTSFLSTLGSDFLLESHLSAMRSLYFMKEGFVFHEFSLNIFKEMREGGQWSEENHLNGQFQEICTESPFFGMDFAHWQAQINRDTTKLSSLQQIERIKLDYLAPWPVNILLNEQISSRYNKILIFLLQIKLAKSAVDEIHSHSQLLNNAALHKLFLLKNKLAQFVNNLQNYVVNRVLKSLWSDLKSSIKSATSFDEIQKIHEQYLNDVRDRCLLNTKATLVLTTIKKILNLCLQFQATIRNLSDNRPNNISIQDFTKLDTEFEQSTLFLVTVLKKIVSQKRTLHLEELLLSINYNNYYSKTFT